MSFQLAYPSHTSPSSTLTFSKSPIVVGSAQQESEGYAAHVMSGQRTVRSYRYSAAYKIYTFAFAGLTPTDKSNFETFRDAALARAFEVLDSNGSCGTVLNWTKVKFDPAGTIRTWQPQPGSTYGVTIILREVD